MKRFIAFLISVSLPLGLFSACADSQNTASNQKSAGTGTAQQTPVKAAASNEVKQTPAQVSTPVSEKYQWKNVQIQGGGFVSGIIFNQTEKGLLYARTDVGGPYRWEPSKREWIPLMDFVSQDDMNFTGILSLATDPTDPNRVYVAAGLYTADWWGKNGAVFASKDKGNTWTRADLPVKIGGNGDARHTGERLQVDPNLPSRLFLGTSTDGLWKSEDNGTTWTKVTGLKSSNISFVCFDQSSAKSGTASKKIIVGTADAPGSIYISADGGYTWKAVSGQPENLYPVRFALFSSMFYVTYTNSIGQGANGATAGAVYKYNLSSGAWTDITPPTGSYGFGGVSVDKQKPDTLIVSTLDCWWPTDEIYRSTDGGKTWKGVLRDGTKDTSKTPYAADRNPHWLADVQIDPFDSNRALFTTGFGLFMTEDLTKADKGQTATWSFEDRGLEETVPLELKSPPSGAHLLSAIGDIGGFRHDDPDKVPAGGTFQPEHSTNISIDFAQGNPDIMVRTHSGGDASTHGSYSKDGGLTWTVFPTEPAGTMDGGSIAVSSDGKTILWTPKGLWSFVSTDFGTTWTSSKDAGGTELKPVADPVNPKKFYAYSSSWGTLNVSVDGGVTFKMAAAGLLSSGQGDLKAVFGKEGHLWLAGGNNGLYYSTDSGTSFTRIDSIDAAGKVAFGKAAPSQEYPAVYIVGKIAGIYGFYRSDDQGKTWVRINDDQHQFGDIRDITADPRVYGRIYIATGGRGIIYGDTTGGAVK